MKNKRNLLYTVVGAAACIAVLAIFWFIGNSIVSQPRVHIGYTNDSFMEAAYRISIGFLASLVVAFSLFTFRVIGGIVMNNIKIRKIRKIKRS